MIYSNNTYDITNDISTYTRTDFSSVYDTSRAKWYMLNNLSQYEEYGIYGTSLDDTKYVGKLVVVNDHEYEWDGTEWDDLGPYVERINGWTNNSTNNFSIKYNGSNYILKATQNDVVFKIQCIQDVPDTQSISFFLSNSEGDRYEYELFYAGSAKQLIYDLGYLKSGHRVAVSQSWLANTEYTIRASNGNYFDTNSGMMLYVNGVLKGSRNKSTYDNASDKITLGYQSTYKYNIEFIIYDHNGPLFDIKCKEDNGQYVLYDALGNGELYNYGTEDPVLVTPITESQRPKDYDTKTAPTITKYYASTIFRNSNHYTKLMQNNTEIGKLDYMSKDVVLKG